MSVRPTPDYLSAFSRLQKTYMYVPQHVHIETTGTCNAHCTFCPHGTMERRGQRMSDELFEKIVQDLKQIPSDIEYAISPFKVNEPLLDPKIFPRMKQLAAELPSAYFWFTSNFNLATPSMLEQLSEIPRLGYIWISLNSLREDEYHQWMGLSLPKTIQNIKRLLQLNREKQFVPNIILGRVHDGTPNDDRFFHDVEAIFAGFETDCQIRFATRGQWMGFLETHDLRFLDGLVAVGLTCRSLVPGR